MHPLTLREPEFETALDLLDPEDELFDELLLDADLEVGRASGRSRRCRSFTIDSASYVRWVQRSLNRLIGSRLRVDGRIGPQTRAAVRRFQQRSRLPATGEVDRRTQDRLIRASEKNRTYVRWIQRTLNLRRAGLKVDGILGRKTRAAIRSFQRREPQLCVDGFVGAKTELRLLRANGGVPPDLVEDDSCSVPRRSAFDELSLELEIEDLETSPSSGVRPRLCLFQNHSRSSHRNHFECGALRQARRIRAIRSPDPAACRRRVGATPYDTGADILAAILAARRCLRRRVDRVHVFSHGFSSGIPGTTAGFAGIYRAGFSLVDRGDGGRLVSDVPAAALADSVQFFLHGCNMAAGQENVARSLFEHLAASLTNPRVFGHRNAGCGGRNNSWREFSNRHPGGRNRASLPNIASTGCCGS